MRPAQAPRLRALATALLLCLWAVLVGAADHYKVLGVSKNSNVKEIRTAFRKLALELHPDKNPAADAAQRFAEVAEAWEVLGDADKRRQYDLGGQQQAFGFGFNPFHHHHHQQQRRTEDLFVDAPLVTRLTAATFQGKVERSTTHWAVNFYATWCGHCVHLAPHWKRAALRLADDADVELGAVNCAVEQQLCQRHGVQSFPTIKFFAVPPEGAGAGGAGNGTEPRHTVAWTTLPQRPDTDAESIADWVRDTAAHAARARVDDLSGAPADFGAAVTQSPLLWVVLFVARGDAASRWCPACGLVETAFFRLSCEFPRDARIGFGLVDCERSREVCVKLGIGHPYTNVRGNFPQALGFAAGGPGRKRRPERLLPSLFRFVDQAVDRLEALEAPLRLAVGLRNPEAAAGVRWFRAKDAANRPFYWTEGAAASVWERPKGWDPEGPDEQTLPEEEEEGDDGAGTPGCDCNCANATAGHQGVQQGASSMPMGRVPGGAAGGKGHSEL